MKKILFVLLISIVIACTRQVPQLPANKSSDADSVSIAIQTANGRLIAGEDSILLDFVRENELDMTKTSSGLWLKIEKATLRKSQHEFDTCKIKYKVYLLTDSLLFEKTETIVIGKKQIINGIEEALKLMNGVGEATLIVPWYLGYGMKGDGQNIQPYSSIIVRLQCLK